VLLSDPSITMVPDSDTDLVEKTKTLLTSVEKYHGDRAARLALVKQLELLRLQIEDPMDSMIRQCEYVIEYHHT
jgi:hypothetical protein